MSFLDFIKNILGNKKETKIITRDLTKVVEGSEQLEVGLFNYNNPIVGEKLDIEINGINYQRTTDNDGIAKLNIKLGIGSYPVIIKYNGNDEYGSSTGGCKVNVIPKSTEPVINNHFGYWVFGRDMKNVNLTDLKAKGVTDIFLNYYAFTTYDESEVLSFVEKANNNNIHIHIWMQCFYDGEWHNPATSDLSNKINEASKYANMKGIKGVHLDYLRYPGNAYKTENGANAITDFVEKIRTQNPNTFLSCAIMPENEGKYYYGQDIEALGKILDAIIPMQYKGNYKAGTSWLASTTKTFSGKANIWSGLQTYKSDDDTTLLSVTELNEDIQTCLNNGAKGVLLFRYGLSNNIDFSTVSGSKKSTKMEGTDINMVYMDGTQYQCAVYDDIGRVAGTVNITINGVTYTKTPDSTGLYKQNIKLQPGTYTIKAEYIGDETHKPSNITNTIKINEKAKAEIKPVKLNSYLSNQGCSGMGQCTGYNCACNSLQQIFYRLTGILVSESTIASVAGTTTSGTGHEGINTAVAWFNKKYNKNIKIKWMNFSDLGNTQTEKFTKLQELINNGAVFFHLLYRDQYGHYEVPKSVSGNQITVYNSLGSYCSYPAYCGYIETRSFTTQQSYINGISQKSTAIFTIEG